MPLMLFINKTILFMGILIKYIVFLKKIKFGKNNGARFFRVFYQKSE